MIWEVIGLVGVGLFVAAIAGGVILWVMAIQDNDKR